ncbi:5-oxoprolinase subunit A [Phycisphaerales bacterium]|nr:5-oxoprolinase subunit A [Phycisphaerales bacterium]
MSVAIDFNCDLGEDPEAVASGRDDGLAAVVSSLNIACGGHAGDEATMDHLVRVARELGRTIGAHPGYPDRANFGRVAVAMGGAEIEDSVRAQVEALCRIARARGAAVTFVKPHGALYHAAMHQREVAEAIARAARAVDAGLVLVGQCGMPGLDWWRARGMKVAAEAFADRRYEPDGALRPRTKAGALLETPEAAAAQAVDIALARGVSTKNGARVEVRADTLCVHADTPRSLDTARAVRSSLESAGVLIRPFESGSARKQ